MFQVRLDEGFRWFLRIYPGNSREYSLSIEAQRGVVSTYFNLTDDQISEVCGSDTDTNFFDAKRLGNLINLLKFFRTCPSRSPILRGCPQGTPLHSLGDRASNPEHPRNPDSDISSLRLRAFALESPHPKISQARLTYNANHPARLQHAHRRRCRVPSRRIEQLLRRRPR